MKKRFRHNSPGGVREVDISGGRGGSRLTMAESLAVSSLALHIKQLLPVSGNAMTSFPIAASHAGVPEAWPAFRVSKLEGVFYMLKYTLENRYDRFVPLILTVLSQSGVWRTVNGDPLTCREFEELDQLLCRMGFRIPELQDEALRMALAPVSMTCTRLLPRNRPAAHSDLIRMLRGLARLKPQARGYAFEKFLVELFAAAELLPRPPFKLVGEQIDGTFVLHQQIFLLEAKWTGKKTGVAELRSFSMKVAERAGWSRGLFIAYSGFTEDGLAAFGRGKPVILMTGQDLYETLNRKLSLVEVLGAKVRYAAESGGSFVPLSDLSLSGTASKSLRRTLRFNDASPEAAKQRTRIMRRGTTEQ